LPRHVSTAAVEEAPNEEIMPTLRSSPPQTNVLGDLIDAPGEHMFTFAVRGDVILGVAESAHDGCEGKAWGVSTSSGCLHHTSSPDDDGYVGIEVAPQRMEGDTSDFLVHMQVDTIAGELRFRHDRSLHWVDTKVKLPSAVRPWARRAADRAQDVQPAVQLLSYNHAPLSFAAVCGLDTLVEGLDGSKQVQALKWCEREGVYDVAAITALDASDDFVEALRLPHHEAQMVRQRLAC